MYSETDACTPLPLNLKAFNSKAELPYGLKTSHIRRAMGDFVDFLGFVNTRLDTKGIQRLESMLMPANFSSIVGEFMTSTIPRYCKSIAKNRYHNGHPDMVPAGMFANDAALFWSLGYKSAHDHSQRHRLWLQEDDLKLDLSG